MAEAISIAASIAGIITLADIVFLRLVKYSKAVKDAVADVKTLAAEVNSLCGSLNSLSRLARALQDEPHDATLRIHHIEGCGLVLHKIRDLLPSEADLENAGSFNGLQRRMMWPLTSSKVKELMVELGRHQQSITMAVSADSLNALLQHLANGAEIQESISRISRQVANTRRITARIHADVEHRKIQKFFMKTDPQDYYETSLGLRHPRTGLWLHREPAFQEWLAVPGSKLWLSGIPGAGKTVLAGSIIEAALAGSSRSVSVAFFFCNYREEATQHPVQVLGALVMQLAVQNDAAYALLDACYHELNPTKGLPRKPTVPVLRALLIQMIAVYEHVLIVVDGLDECGKYTEEVVSSLAPLGGLGKTVSIALVSRDESNIRDILADSFTNIEIAAHSEDISEYVLAEIHERLRMRRLKISDIALQDEIQQSLIEGAKGMFRWVACQLDHLGHCFTDYECREALKKLPPDLPETYMRILKRVPKPRIAFVQMILNFIAYADPPLPVDRLLQVVSVPKSGAKFGAGNLAHEDSIMRYCSSLVRKSNDGATFVFAHFSVQEFLDSEYLDNDDVAVFRASKSRCRRLLAKQCLKFLHLQNFSGRLPLELPELVDAVESRHKDYPFYQWAALTWFLHAEGEWDDKELFDLAIRLFDSRKSPNFMNWMFEMHLAAQPQESSRAIDHQLLERLLHQRFTPLHLAAALGLPKICQELILRGYDTDATGPFGTALHCSTHGLGFIDGTGAHQNYAVKYSFVENSGCTLHPLAETIQILLAASPCSPTGSSFLPACRLSLQASDWSMVLVLLSTDMPLRAEDLRELETMLEHTNEYGDRASKATKALEAFIASLNELIDKSPLHLSLCSTVWEFAVVWQLPCTLDPNIMDSRVSRSDEVLDDWAFTAVRMVDVEALERYLQDPRAKPAEIRNEKQQTLVHVVLKSSYDAGIDIQSRLSVLRTLLRAGCDLSAVDEKGYPPFHRWCWSAKADGPVETATQYLLEEATKAAIGAGHDMTATRSTSGSNILHDCIGSNPEIMAIMDVLPKQDLDKALRHLNNKGNTPLAEAMQDLVRGKDTALALLARGNHSNETWRGSSPVLQMAAELGSAEVLKSLLESGLTVDEDTAGQNPQYHIGRAATPECVQILKELLPGFWGSLEGQAGTPLKRYLKACCAAPGTIRSRPSFRFWPPREEVLAELTVPEHHPNRDKEKMLVWGYFVTDICWLEHPPERKAHARSTFLQAARFLLTDGYFTAYESETRQSALAEFLRPFKWDHVGLSKFGCRFLLSLTEQTQRWTDILEDAPLSWIMLMTAYHEQDVPLFQKLLDMGFSLQTKRGKITILEQMCSTPPPKLDSAKFMQIIESIGEHSSDLFAGRPNTTISDLSLLHCIWKFDSPWLVEKMVGWGADPDVRAGVRYDRCPAILFHLYNSAFKSAEQLLDSGADPTLHDDQGFDAALTSCEVGTTDFLEVLINARDATPPPPWAQRINWARRFTLSVAGPANVRYHVAGANAWHLCAYRGNLGGLEFYKLHNLIPRGEHSRSDPIKITPLHLAAAAGRVEVVEYLIGLGADISFATSDGDTPLHLAVVFGQVGAVKALLRLGATITTARDGETPLSLAYRGGKHGIISLIRTELRTLTTLRDPTMADSRVRKGLEHAFCAAVFNGHLDICKSLWSEACSLDLDLLNIDLRCGGCSPLFMAVAQNQKDVVAWLLSEGASTTKASCKVHGGLTLLKHLVRTPNFSDEATTRSLVKSFAKDGGDLYDYHMLIFAIECGHNVGLKLILEEMQIQKDSLSCDSDQAETTIWTLISSHSDEHSSVTRLMRKALNLGNIVAVELLVKHGALNESVFKCESWLLLTAAIASPAMLKPASRDRCLSLVLDAMGACPSSHAQDGNTPLMFASHRGIIDVVERLLKAGADPSITTPNTDSTALHIAAWGGHASVFARLALTGKVDQHSPDANGVSAVHLAIQHAHLTSILLNGDFQIEDTRPFSWTKGLIKLMLTDTWVAHRYRFYKRRIPKTEDLLRIMNLEPLSGWSPLCLAVSQGLSTIVQKLLDAGAKIDHKGSPDGPALMLACAGNRFQCVKVLIRNGAKETFTGADGIPRSAVASARRFKLMVEWLLVKRYTEQQKLTAAAMGTTTGVFAASEQADQGTEPPLFQTLSPLGRAEYVIMGQDERLPSESSFDYYKRLMQIKREMCGIVVATGAKGETCRPSRLVPLESVRRHPDDNRSPR